MLLPRWLAKVNKRVFNPREVKKGKYPVLTHLGRTSGREYRTPMDAFRIDGGFILAVRYGPGSDWVQNTLRSGSGRLSLDGTEHQLHSPRLMTESEAVEAGFVPPPKYTRTDTFLFLKAD